MKCLFYLLFFIPILLFPQQNIDKTVAVVGKYIVMRSDVEKELKSLRNDNVAITDTIRCSALEELLYQKLLLAQAEKDSVTVKDEQVESELDRRMTYFVRQLGSEERFEAYYGKTIKQYKEELREDVKNILIGQQMQNKIAGDTKVSPAEVRDFYSKIPEDSLPTVNSEVEICQLTKQPVVSDTAKKLARAKLESYRARVLNGESMSVIATLYSEDPGSARAGGRIDGVTRGMMVPEFEAVAFRLKPGEVSEVFETPYGYHFMQLISRKGEVVDIRHILLIPKVSEEDVIGAKTTLDRVYHSILEGDITFCNAVMRYSDDKETKNNCGTMVNNAAGTSRFEVKDLGEMDQQLVFMLEKMKEGEISKPLLQQAPDGKQSFRIIFLRHRTEPHKINLKDDYMRLQTMTQNSKQKSTIDIWINRKVRSIFIKIAPEYQTCTFHHKWYGEASEMIK